LAQVVAGTDEAARRAALRALGTLQDPASEVLLLDSLAKYPTQRKTIVEALGKIGGPAALARVADLGAAEGDRITTRAQLRLERTVHRPVGAQLRIPDALPTPYGVVAHCRRGLEALLAAELVERGAQRPVEIGVGCVRSTASADLHAFFSARTALDVGFPLEVYRRDGEDDADVLARFVRERDVVALFSAFGAPPFRFRVSFAGAGKRRSVVWKLAETVRGQAAGAAINDPTNADWELRVRMASDVARVHLTPRGLPDTRFAYRALDVPAASHPTIAAALARVAEARPSDRVWDPFVGSGSELIERARLGPYGTLIGTDIDPKALAAAHENMRNAAVTDATLLLEDALTFESGLLDLVITNPPLGRRVARDAGLRGLLKALMRRAARSLAPQGRLVWIAPHPEEARQTGTQLGLTLTQAFQVDMGGFPCELQRWDKAL
jgi:23S rRNA G2445 N2-methylase RlmL